ncbi:MAG: S16 family serine protease [Candidatus Nanopelagicaceae bacterium]
MPAPFAVISPGPVTDLLKKGMQISGDKALKTSGNLYSLSVYVNNPESRPPGLFVLAAWISGDSVVLPNEVVYEIGETTKSADKAAKREMANSESIAAIAAANFLKKLNPDAPLNWSKSDIKFAMKNVGGPSAGLAFSLALIARLKFPEIVDGRKIAVTGKIDESGKVGGIGGIDQKLIAARKAGASIALFPRANCDDITVKPQGLELVAVSNLTEAFHGLMSPKIAASLRCSG